MEGTGGSDHPPNGDVAGKITSSISDDDSSINLAQSLSTLDATQRRPAYLLQRDRIVGRGSYGQVCIASRGDAEGRRNSIDDEHGRERRKKFACKCILLRDDPKYTAKLQEEVNVLRELRGHDNVIRLYDVFCVDDELFIITELGRGGNLCRLVESHPRKGMSEAYTAKTVAEMLSAISFLHSRHICHRDLKLENWVLRSGDPWSTLKLIDFGLSTHYTPGHRLSRVVGSFHYVAPEVLKRSYTEACDIWSLGVIVYILLSGHAPFTGGGVDAIKASILRGAYSYPSEMFRDVSDGALEFVSCLLSYSVEHRHTAVQALMHPWLGSNCDSDHLRSCKNGASGAIAEE
jgi:serine/threonine protein kinase